jgi:hypothetical protein
VAGISPERGLGWGAVPAGGVDLGGVVGLGADAGLGRVVGPGANVGLGRLGGPGGGTVPIIVFVLRS